MHFGQKFIVRAGKERDDRGRGKGVLWIADSAWNWNTKIKLEENPDMEWRGENTFHQWFFAGQIKHSNIKEGDIATSIHLVRATDMRALTVLCVSMSVLL